MWNYKVIYRLYDKQVGQWSEVVSVTVGGRRAPILWGRGSE